MPLLSSKIFVLEKFLKYIYQFLFSPLRASFLNIFLVQKNITELAVELKRLIEKTQIKIPNSSNSFALAANGVAITGGKKQSVKKQTTTIKEDLACLICWRNNFIFPKLFL